MGLGTYEARRDAGAGKCVAQELGADRVVPDAGGDDYKTRIRSLDQAPGDPTVPFHGERRSNQTQRPTTDPDANLTNKESGTAALVGYAVNGLMENRPRAPRWDQYGELLGLAASETDWGREVIDAFHKRHGLWIQMVGSGKGYIAKRFMGTVFRQLISPTSHPKPPDGRRFISG